MLREQAARRMRPDPLKTRKDYVHQTVGGANWSTLKHLAYKARLIGGAKPKVNVRELSDTERLKAAIKLPKVISLLWHHSDEGIFEEKEASYYADTYEYRITGFNTYQQTPTKVCDDEEMNDVHFVMWGKSLPFLPSEYAKHHPIV